MKKDKIEEYLVKYSNIAEKWIADRPWLIIMHHQYNDFFRRENLENADWAYFQKLKTEKLIHSFNVLPLAGQRALGEQNHPIEHYRKVFIYLKYGKDKDNIRFNNLIDKNSGYSLAFFGKSAISELIGQAFPEKYIFYNSRDVAALRFLNIELDEKNKKFGDLYVEYAELIRKQIVSKFTENVKTRFDAELPIGLRIDQFFSWIYEEHIYNNLTREENAKPKGKITRIEIQSYNQFKNFKLNLTYPKGHSKEGKPLDKVCFIGQSGTGKTTFLDLIKYLTIGDEKKIPNLSNDKKIEIHYHLADMEELRKIEYRVILDNEKITVKILTPVSKKSKKTSEIETQIGATAFPTLMYFPPDIISQINMLDREVDDNSFTNSENSFKEEIIDFSLKENNEIIKIIWNNLLFRISEYRKLQNNQKIKLANLILSSSEEKKSNAIEQFNIWKSQNPNPLEDLAKNYLNTFLHKFNLKINTEPDTNKIFRIEPLFENTEIKPEFLSTGTKQIILRTLPFYSLWDNDNENGLPHNSIILIDEPENSLYPDIQREIVDYFQSLTENCQFFYATHSPIIASCFEPCERFILNFNENGNVVARIGISPEGAHSNEILKSEYETSLLGKEGVEMWNRFIELPNLIALETDGNKKRQLMDEYMNIGITYNFVNNEANTKR